MLILPSAIEKYPSSNSIPMKFLLRLEHATPVVPVPMNGSNIVAPFEERLEITFSAHSPLKR